MSTAPIINISNLGGNTAAATKAGNQATSPDQSFGQVLSREVGRNNADSNNSNNGTGNNNVNGNGNGNGNVGPTATPAPAASSSPSASDGKTAKTKTGDKSSETADSSANTNASTSPTANTDAASASASAQLLALVNNVQQNTVSSKSDASIAAGAIPGSPSIGSATGVADLAAQAALGNFQATAASVGKTADLPTRAIDNASTTVALPQGLEVELKNIKLTDSSTAATAKNATAETSVIEKQGASNIPAGAPAATLDLSATAEKNLQAGLAALDANAVKIEQTSQTAPTILPSANAQQAMLNVQALPGNPNDKITPQVGSSGWDQAVGQKVVWMVAGGQQNASLTLNPPDLGPMQVVLSVTNSHATVTFTAAQPEVRQALETAMPKLREMLGDAGIQLGQASINSGSAQQQNMASQQGSHNSGRSTDTGGTVETAITAARPVATSAGLGMVDTFA